MATALEMVKRMQRKLRLPQASTITEPHAAIMLECLNNAQRNLLPESYVWDELKVYGSFNTSIGNALYNITGTDDKELDVLRNLEITGNHPFIHLTDSAFREKKRALSSTPGQPVFYRNYAREGGASLVIEVTPTPDAIYTVETEALVKPKKLIADGDEILLDEDTLFLAAMFLATESEGLDYQAALSLYQAKLSLIGENQGESNWGDIEAI